MKPTQEQVTEWSNEAGLYASRQTDDKFDWKIIYAQQFAALAYEAGRKDENEACAKQVGQRWDAFQELKAAHYRNSPEPFDPFRFHRDLSTIFFSRDMADAIRARREQ